MTRVELDVDATNVRDALTTVKYDFSPWVCPSKDAKFAVFTEFTKVKVRDNPESLIM